MINDITEEKLIHILPILHEKIMKNMLSGIINKEFTILSDIRDYFMFQIINCSNKEKAKIIILKYDKYALYFDILNLPSSEFYKGFFFSLSNILSLKYELIMFKNEKISYKEFQDSFKETLKDLNFDEV